MPKRRSPPARDRLEQLPKGHDDDNEHGVGRLPRRPVTEERPHHQSEIERGKVCEVALTDVVAAPQPHATMRARLACEGEGALDSLAS
jgi:hypothetical protein